MLVNLSDVLTSEGMELAREVPLELICYENGTESFDIVSKSPVSLTVSNAGADKAVLRGKLELSLRGACSRCLAEVPVDLSGQSSLLRYRGRRRMILPLWTASRWMWTLLCTMRF